MRTGAEEPHYIRRPLTDAVEIRQYGPRIAAETSVDGEQDHALRIGFRRLAHYIFGANHRAQPEADTPLRAAVRENQPVIKELGHIVETIALLANAVTADGSRGIR